MQKKVKISLIICVLLFVSITCNYIEKALYGDARNRALSILKVLSYLCIIVIGTISLQKGHKKRVFKKEFKSIIIITIAFAIFSLILELVRQQFTTYTYLAIWRLFYPGLVAYIVSNFISDEQLDKLMKVLLFVLSIAYVVEIGLNTFIVSNFALIGEEGTNSPFESSYFADPALLFFCYFYYRKRKSFYSIFSAIFVFLTFKRLAMLLVLLLIFLPRKVNIYKKINWKWQNVAKVFFILVTPIYFVIVLHDRTNFSASRWYYLKNLLSSNFKSYGYGSIKDFLGYQIEMDLISIMIELGVLGLVIFVWFYWNLCGDTLFGYLMWGHLFANLVTSHTLENAYASMLRLVVIGCITYKINGRDLYEINIKKKKQRLHIR